VCACGRASACAHVCVCAFVVDRQDYQHQMDPQGFYDAQNPHAEHMDSSGQDHGLTLSFDACGGHGDSQNRYHYHMPPTCLLKNLGSPVPNSSSWWTVGRPEEEWPRSGASVLVGWAIDGFPILGPYHPDTGKLQMPKAGNSGCQSTLDDCNGALLGDGSYAYFITPIWPFLPQCLRGSKIATDVITEGPLDDIVVCPKLGFAPAFENSSRECHTIPQFVFRTVGSTSPHRVGWIVSSAIIGAIWVVFGLGMLAIVRPWEVRARQIHKWDENTLISTVSQPIPQANLTAFLHELDPKSGCELKMEQEEEECYKAQCLDFVKQIEKAAAKHRRRRQELEDKIRCQKYFPVPCFDKVFGAYPKNYYVENCDDKHVLLESELLVRKKATIGDQCALSDSFSMKRLRLYKTWRGHLLRIEDLDNGDHEKKTKIARNDLLMASLRQEQGGEVCDQMKASAMAGDAEVFIKNRVPAIGQDFGSNAPTEIEVIVQQDVQQDAPSAGLNANAKSVSSVGCGFKWEGIPLRIASSHVVVPGVWISVAGLSISFEATAIECPDTGATGFRLSLTEASGAELEIMAHSVEDGIKWHTKLGELVTEPQHPLTPEQGAELEVGHLVIAMHDDLASLLRIYICNNVVIWTRAIFLLVDPYSAYKMMPNFLIAICYGLYFPCINLQAVELCHTIGLRGSLYSMHLYVCVGQFVTQIVMDGLRSWGAQPGRLYALLSLSIFFRHCCNMCILL